MSMRKALYYQETKNHDLEYSLIEKTVARESVFKRFKFIERAVKEKRRPFDDEARLELLVLLNDIRRTTLDVLDEIIEWQKMFVKAKRPTIMSEDYLLEMARSTEFVNASPLKKYFNFTVSRQNIFLLLMRTGKPKDPVDVTPAMNVELQKLADPDMDRVINAYKLFKKTYPKKKFSALLPLGQWAKSLWMPDVRVVTPCAVSLPPMINAEIPHSPISNAMKSPSNKKEMFKHSVLKKDSPVKKSQSLRSSSSTSERVISDNSSAASTVRPSSSSTFSRDTRIRKKESSPRKLPKTNQGKKKTSIEVIPPTIGGSILDINNSIVLKPQSTLTDNLSKYSCESNPINKIESGEQVDRTSTTKKTERADGDSKGMDDSENIPSAKVMKSPTKRRKADKKVLSMTDDVSTSSSAAFNSDIPVSTMHLSEWFRSNGVRPTEYVQILPAFPTKRNKAVI